MNNLSADVIKFLKENGPPPPVTDEDLTAQVAAEQWHVSPSTAELRLDELVKAGKLKTDERRAANGRRVLIYVPKKS